MVKNEFNRPEIVQKVKDNNGIEVLVCQYRDITVLDGVVTYEGSICGKTFHTNSIDKLLSHWRQGRKGEEKHGADPEKFLETLLIIKKNKQPTAARPPGCQLLTDPKFTQSSTWVHKPCDSQLVGLTRDSFSAVAQLAYRHAMGEKAKIRSVLYVPVMMRDFGARLQNFVLCRLTKRFGVLVYDSGTIRRERYLPILLLIHGYKPILLCLNADDCFAGRSHTAAEVKRIAQQCATILKSKYDIGVLACVADGAANMQADVAATRVEDLPFSITGTDHLDFSEENDGARSSADDAAEDAALPGHYAITTITKSPFTGTAFATTVVNDTVVNQLCTFRDIPHLLDNIVHSLVEKDDDIANALLVIPILLAECKAADCPLSVRRIVKTRWKTHFDHFVDFKDKVIKAMEAHQDPEDDDDMPLGFPIEREDVRLGTVTKAINKLKPLTDLIDIAQASRATTFHVVYVVQEVRRICRRDESHITTNNDDKNSSSLSKSICFVNEKNELTFRWAPFINEASLVICALCPVNLVHDFNDSQKKYQDVIDCLLDEDELKTSIGIEHLCSEQVIVILRSWFGESVARQYEDFLAYGVSLLASRPQLTQLISPRHRPESQDKITLNEYKDWWSNVASTTPEYKELVNAIKIVLDLPSTEADCERLFSLLKEIVGAKRASLKPINVEGVALVSQLWEISKTQSTATLSGTTVEPPSNTMASIISPPRSTILDRLTISRDICHNLLRLKSLMDHNSSLTTEAKARFKIPSLHLAFLFPQNKQDNFEDGFIRIPVTAATKRDVPHHQQALSKTFDKKVRADKIALRDLNSDEATESRCGNCGKIWTEHKRRDERDSCVDCKGCTDENDLIRAGQLDKPLNNIWVHISCSHLNNLQFYAKFVTPEDEHKEIFYCDKHVHLRAARGGALERRRRARQQAAEEDE